MQATGELHILVADDHEVVRRGLKCLLEPQTGWSVVGEASNGSQAVAKAAELKPEVALLDVGMPELNGLEATRRIREALPTTEVLVLTVHDSEQMLQEALSSGARGYLVKSDAGRDLISAVDSVSRHTVFVSPSVSRGDDLSPARPAAESPLSRLTSREHEIIHLLAEGHSNKDIAVRLDISVKTVETHRTSIMRKIGVHSIADLVRYAIRNNLVEV